MSKKKDNQVSPLDPAYPGHGAGAGEGDMVKKKANQYERNEFMATVENLINALRYFRRAYDTGDYTDNECLKQLAGRLYYMLRSEEEEINQLEACIEGVQKFRACFDDPVWKDHMLINLGIDCMAKAKELRSMIK